MQTLEQQLKKELRIPNYCKEVFNIDFIDHVDSDGTCFIELNTGNKDQDVATLEQIQEHLKSETKEIVNLECYFDDCYFGMKKYDGSVLVLKLK